jgi:hypothetical protein
MRYTVGVTGVGSRAPEAASSPAARGGRSTGLARFRRPQPIAAALPVTRRITAYGVPLVSVRVVCPTRWAARGGYTIGVAPRKGVVTVSGRPTPAAAAGHSSRVSRHLVNSCRRQL